MKNVNINLSGINVLLTIILCILKVSNILNISWVWVLCPIWINLILILVILFIIFIIALLRK